MSRLLAGRYPFRGNSDEARKTTMVTRIYTPLVQPYARPKSSRSDQGVGEGDERREHSPYQQAMGGAEAARSMPATSGFVSQQQVTPQPGLQSLQAQQQSARIPLKAVLSDFSSTMDALGTDNAVRSEVETYMRVIHLQAGKEKPEIPFIKHTLRTAAGTLDQFISQALGQPSRVVREWMDALLMQDIDYKDGDGSASASASASTLFEQSDPASQNRTPLEAKSATQTHQTPVSREGLKHLIETAKSFQQAGRYGDADHLIQEALARVDDRQPQVAGKLWNMRARFYEQAGDWQKAVGFYQQAAELFEKGENPRKQGHALYGAATLLDTHNQLPAAERFYRQAIAIDRQHGEPENLVRSLNDLGSVLARQNQPQEALGALQEAYAIHKRLPAGSAELTSDLLSNIAQVYHQQGQSRQAVKAYQMAAAQVKAVGDKALYQRTLGQLANLADSSGLMAEARQARQKLAALSQ